MKFEEKVSGEKVLAGSLYVATVLIIFGFMFQSVASIFVTK